VKTKARRWRELFESEGVIRIAGAHDGLTAKLVELTGFDAVWAGGFEVSTSYAVPDADILTMSQYLQSASIMNDAVSIPVVADCDTGYGNSNNVMHMVRKYEAAGIVAVSIEDKKYPKVNSYVPGRQELAPISEFVGKILAAKNARRTDDFMVIARVEALIAGWGQDEALKRAHTYVEAGADAIFIHSKASTSKEIVSFTRAWDFSAPLIICPTSYPTMTLQEIEQLGIKAVIYANQGIRAAIKATMDVLSEIAKMGRLDTIGDRIVSMDNVFELQGMGQLKEQEKIYLSTTEEPIRVVIPAAGKPHNQESLEPLLKEVPTAMLDINGKPLLQRNVETLSKAKLHDISVINGYNKDKFNVGGVSYIENPMYEREHILSSLMCAEAKMDGKTLVIYSDLLFESWLIERLKSAESDFVVVIDSSFKWTRKRNKKFDLVMTKEKLAQGNRLVTMDRLYNVVKIGSAFPEEMADAEFIGMAIFSKKGSEIFRREYHKALEQFKNKPFIEAENIYRASMEDFLQYLINLGYKVEALQVNSGWMEIHTFDNYKEACGITEVL
jgi:phosphoenolpyruvate phosphomutase